MKKAFFLILLLFSSGCIQEDSIESRLACINLTSYSFTSIPKCTSQDSCFLETEKAFSFNSSVLSPKAQEYIFDSRNNLARSWLFMNNAKSNLDKINSLCYSAKDFSLIPVEVNELRNNFIEIGNSIDSFNVSASKSIAFETAYLEIQDINLINEEFIFDDFIILNQNIVDFHEKNLYSDTYASSFLLQAEKFSMISEALSFEETVHESTILSLLSDNEKTIISEMKKNDFPLLFIAPVFFSASNFINNFFSISDSVESLEALPSFEVLSAIEKILGKNNSSASRFFEIFKSEQNHLIELNSRNEQQKQEIRDLLDLSHKRIVLISEKYSDGFSEAYYILDENSSGLTSVSFELNFDNFPENIYEKESTIKSELHLVEEAEILNSMSLGVRTQKIKSILSSAKSLSEEIFYYENFAESMGLNCSEKVLLIEEKLNKSEFESTNPVIISLKSRLRSEIQFFKKSKEIESCFKIISSFDELNSKLSENVPEELISEEIISCILETESLSTKSENLGLNEQFASLKLIEEPYENPELVLNSCEDLKSRFLIDLKSNVEVIEAESFFDDLSEKLALFESIVSNFPESNLTDVKKFIDEMSEIASFFDESELNISDLTSNELSAFNSELESKSEFSDSLLKKVVQEIFYSYYSLDFFKSENKNLARISFDNKGKEIKEYFEVYIPLDTSNAEKVFSTGNITYVSKDDETILKFSGLLKGLNSIIFDLNLNNIQQSDSNKTEPVFFDLDNISEITKILAEKNELVKKSELISNSDEIKKIELEIEDLTKNNKLDEAKQKLLLLKDEINLIEKENENNEKNSAKEFIELILEIEINKEKLLEKTEFTESIFSSLNENELPEVYAFSPITFQRIQELKKIAQKTLGISSAELNKLFSESKFFEILAFKESINTDIISSEIETALNEVDSATEKMKQNALSAYNVAVSKRNSSTSNSTADELLLKSKKNLEEKNYLESILQSNNAIGFLVIPKDPGFEIPLTVYPMLLVIFSVLGYMYWRSKKEEEPKPIKIIKKAE